MFLGLGDSGDYYYSFIICFTLLRFKISPLSEGFGSVSLCFMESIKQKGHKVEHSSQLLQS